MKIFVIGKLGSVTQWLEDAARAFAGDGHAVEVGVVRNAWIHIEIEKALMGTTAARLRRRIGRFRPDLILAIGAYHVPRIVLETIAALPGRPPLIGWVGDVFADDVAGLANLYDVVAYTDSALVRRHRELGLAPGSLYLPHAVDPARGKPKRKLEKQAAMVFVATPTPGREAVVGALERPIRLYGRNWRPSGAVPHEVHARRLAKSALPVIYGSHLAALNIRNERNVLSGLNQRSFEPALSGAALVADNQADLALCFDPGEEVYVWNDVDALNEIHSRILADPSKAARIGQRGRERVLAQHTYSRRLHDLADLVR